jgi:molybdopterin-guanine dinucleotide biosynthesis protein A
VSNFDAIVVAGGRSTRFRDGVDKRSLVVGGSTLLDRVVAALADAQQIIVAGPRIAVRRRVLWVREAPTGGGPVAGLAAALGVVTAETVVVLAADLPFVTRRTVERLVRSIGAADGALVCADGVRQPLCAAYRVQPLRSALAEFPVPAGLSMRQLIAGLALADVDDARAAIDCDTWDDVVRARRLAASAVC